MKSFRLATFAGAFALTAFALPATTAGAATTGPNLSGTWKIDRAKSESPAPPPGMGRGGGGEGTRGGGTGGGGHRGGGMRGGGGMPGGGSGGEPGVMPGEGKGGEFPEGGRGAGEARDGGPRGGGDGERGMQRPGLPPFMRIAPSTYGLGIADSAGTMVQEITLKPVPDNAPAIEKHAPRVPGVWKGDKLTVTRTNSRGVKVIETFSLEEAGRTLVVQTKMQPADGAGFEFKRVYHRAG